ncbi:MAG: ParB N-terminal domain-containing protein, partial [Streptococcaceae bacterium]|nr:ParB N-terminal domain-containing protein [Streptococcaceae bacterium]
MDKYEIEYRLVDELMPYTNNPRDNKEAIDLVAASIKEFGFLVPVVIDKDDVLVCGHTRILGAKKLNMKEVPTIKANALTPAQIKAFRLADNRVAEKATWNEEMLAIELEQLLEMDFDMKEFDFDIEELNLEEKDLTLNDEDPKRSLSDTF